MNTLEEVIKLSKKIEELRSESLEQLHYEKMLAYKWKLIAIVFISLAVASNLLWLYAWNEQPKIIAVEATGL